MDKNANITSDFIISPIHIVFDEVIRIICTMIHLIRIATISLRFATTKVQKIRYYTYMLFIIIATAKMKKTDEISVQIFITSLNTVED